MRRLLLLGAAVLGVGGVVVMVMAEKHLRNLSTEIGSHIAVPSVKRLSLNGREVVAGSIRGRRESGPPDPFVSRDGLEFDLAWYDILAQRAYAIRFSVASKEVSTFGTAGDHGSISILTGPGADVTVTTPNPEALRLIGLKRMDEITPGMEADVTLRRLCAEALDPSGPDVLQLATAVENWALDQAMQNRDRWLLSNAMPVSRCADHG